jgi:hypothetical protein
MHLQDRSRFLGVEVKMKIFSSCMLALSSASLVLATSCGAAELAFVAGYGGKHVLLLRGSEKVPVDGQMLLVPGDRVQAGKGSHVEVKYIADGCSLRVAEGNSILVARSSPCLGVGDEAKASVAGQDVMIAPDAAGGAAALITNKTGTLSRVNLGSGLVELKAGMELAVGSSVYVGSESTVTVFFVRERCSYTLGAETYLDITDRAPCMESVSESTSTTLTNSTSIDQHAIVPAASKSAAATSAGLNGIGLAVGATALVGGVALVAVAMSGDEQDNDIPATPQ